MSTSDINTQAPVIISIYGETKKIEMASGTLLLDGAISSGANLDHSCWAGRCGRCQVQVSAGMDNLSDPTREEMERLGADRIGQGYRLACQVRVYGPVEVNQD